MTCEKHLGDITHSILPNMQLTGVTNALEFLDSQTPHEVMRHKVYICTQAPGCVLGRPNQKLLFRSSMDSDRARDSA
jgi:hypothetical protein